MSCSHVALQRIEPDRVSKQRPRYKTLLFESAPAIDI
jgi:hypothetical protein